MKIKHPMPIKKISVKAVTTSLAILFLVILTFLHFELGDVVELHYRERKLLLAVQNKDLDAFFRYSVNKPPEKYTAAERNLSKRIGMKLLENFVSSDQTLWNDTAAEYNTVFWFLMLGDSQIHGGLGIGDTSEGYQLLQLAKEKLMLINPEDYATLNRITIRRLQDGSVATGMQISSK